MRKAFITLLFILSIPAQQLDTLSLQLENPEGGGVIGVQIGYSKLVISSPVEDLVFDPAHTKSNSKDFKVIPNSEGYEIIVNMNKLKTDNRYFPLRFEISHPGHHDFEAELNIKPGRSYLIKLNSTRKIINKSTTYIIRVSPPGSKIFLNGREMNAERKELTDDLEELRFTYDFTLLRREEIKVVNWSVVPENEENFLPALSTDEIYSKSSSLWYLSYLTPDEKNITQEIRLTPIDNSISTWTYIGGALLAGTAIYFATKETDSGPGKLDDINGATGGLPNTKRNFKVGKRIGISFGVNF